VTADGLLEFGERGAVIRATHSFQNEKSRAVCDSGPVATHRESPCVSLCRYVEADRVPLYGTERIFEDAILKPDAKLKSMQPPIEWFALPLGQFIA
jgi:hypothetical protein